VSIRLSKLALITGASKGVGAAIARTLSENGFAVLLTARDEAALSQVTGYLQAEGAVAYAVAADITTEEGIAALDRAVAKTGVDLGLLVHNAGMARVGKVAEMKKEDWQAVLNLNLTTPFLLTQKLLPRLHAGSQIIFINSIGGRQVFAEWSAYCASKYGLRALADSLRQEVAEQGIRVTSIFPGAVDTPLHDNLPYDWARDKMMKPADVAAAVLYCARQAPNVRINELELESVAGKF